MNFKKLLALLMALVMALCLVACGNDETPEDTSDNGNTDSSVVDPGFYDLEGNKLLGASDTFMTIDGVEVPFDIYRYMYQMIDINYFSGGDMTYWQSYEVMYPTLLQYVETFVKEYMWATLLAEKYDIELNEDDLALVESSMTQQREMYGEEYETLLAQAGLTDELLVRLTTADVLSERVYQELLGKEGAMLRPTDEELKNTALTDYVRVHHVLVNYDHFSGLEGYENATEEELKQAALDLANELLEKINNGEDLYAISQEYGDDPGMENNVNGYYFTYGKMVEPFEKASFALEVGGVSGLVETDYGYHIIQRLEQADYIEANWETVSDSILSDEFNVIINDVMENAKVEYCDEYANINYASIK